MRYLVMTDVSPEDVIRRAREFFAAHTLLAVADESTETIRFEGDIGGRGDPGGSGARTHERAR